MRCERCGGSGRVCAEHPGRPHGHDACRADGERCPACQERSQRPASHEGWTPFATPPAGQVSRPPERLWTLAKGTLQIACEILYHGPAFGFETRLIENGEFVYSRRYPLRSGALAEADYQLKRWHAEGFTPPATEPQAE